MTYLKQNDIHTLIQLCDDAFNAEKRRLRAYTSEADREVVHHTVMRANKFSDLADKLRLELEDSE